MALVTRIERLEAESAIRRLMADYCHGFDKREWDRFASVWQDGSPTAPGSDRLRPMSTVRAPRRNLADRPS